MSRLTRLLAVLAAVLVALGAGLSLAACTGSHRTTPGAGAPPAPASSVPSPSVTSPVPSSSAPAPAPIGSTPPTGGPGATQGAPDSGTGIDGVTVAIGRCPVVRNDSCPDKPFAAGFTVIDVGAGTTMAVHSGADGHFRVAVRPGKYLLRAPTMMSRAAPMSVTVDAGRYTTVTMRFDTGVR